MSHEISRKERDQLVSKANQIINESIRTNLRKRYTLEKLRDVFEAGQEFESKKISNSQAFQVVKRAVNLDNDLEDRVEVNVDIVTLRKLVNEVEK